MNGVVVEVDEIEAILSDLGIEYPSRSERIGWYGKVLFECDRFLILESRHFKNATTKMILCSGKEWVSNPVDVRKEIECALASEVLNSI